MRAVVGGAIAAEAAEGRRRVLGPDKPPTLLTMMNLAWIYELQGKAAQAETLAAEVVAIRRRV